MHLRRWLEETGISQNRLARDLDLGPWTVSRMINGTECPSPAEIIDIDRYTGGKITIYHWAEMYPKLYPYIHACTRAGNQGEPE